MLTLQQRQWRTTENCMMPESAPIFSFRRPITKNNMKNCIRQVQNMIMLIIPKQWIVPCKAALMMSVWVSCLGCRPTPMNLSVCSCTQNIWKPLMGLVRIPSVFQELNTQMTLTPRHLTTALMMKRSSKSAPFCESLSPIPA